MDDLISRQDAIEHFKAEEKVYGNGAFTLEEIEHELSRMPSAERMGKWKEVYAETDYRNGWIEFSCECCEYQHGLESGEYDWHYGDEIPWKYCPICGARMGE